MRRSPPPRGCRRLLRPRARTAHPDDGLGASGTGSPAPAQPGRRGWLALSSRPSACSKSTRTTPALGGGPSADGAALDAYAGGGEEGGGDEGGGAGGGGEGGGGDEGGGEPPPAPGACRG